MGDDMVKSGQMVATGDISHRKESERVSVSWQSQEK